MSGCLNGHPMVGFMMVVSLSVKLDFQEAFSQCPFLSQNLCSMYMLVILNRGEYEMTRSKQIFPHDLYPCLTRTNI